VFEFKKVKNYPDFIPNIGYFYLAIKYLTKHLHIREIQAYVYLSFNSKPLKSIRTENKKTG